MTLHHSYQAVSRRSQRGIAAILLVLLVGLSLSIAVMGTMHYIKSEQDSTVTAHAVTTAQMKAWNGLEAFRQYLNSIGQTAAAALPTTAPGNVVTLSGGAVSNGITGTITNVATSAAGCSSGTQVTASFTGSNQGTAGTNSAATVQGVFCVVTTGGGTTTPSAASGGMVIHGNLTTSGAIKFDGSNSANMTVIGNLNDSGTLDGINNLYVTGSINLASTGTVNNVQAQGDVTIANTGSFQSVGSQGNVTVSSPATITTVNANGSVTFTNSATVGTVNALAGATAAGQPSTLTVGTGFVTTAGAQTLPNVNTNGSLQLSNATVNNLAAAGSLVFQDNYSVVRAGKVGTGFSPAGSSGTTNGSHVTLANGFMPTYAANTVPVGAIALPAAPAVDAWANKGLANYAFDVDRNNFIRVSITNVNGIGANTGAAAISSLAGTTIPAGAWYVLGSGANQDMLCPTSTYSASTCTVRVCYAGSQNNTCFTSAPSYTGGAINWSIASVATTGQALPPGVVWFNGNVNWGLGTYFDTVMATGNITTSANNVTYAPNYVGYGNVANPNPNAKIGTAGVCVNNPFNTALATLYPSQNLYPTNFCPTPLVANCVPSSANNYCGYQGAANPMGNIAMYAGSYAPGTTTFGGGLVTLAASSTIFGNIISADTVSFGGSNYVAGYVNALQQSGTNSSSFAASTTIDLTNYPPTFNPCVSLAGCNTGGGAGTTTTTVQWTRYQ